MNLTKPALLTIMSAFFIVGMCGIAFSQDAGDEAVPEYADIMWGFSVDGDSCVLSNAPAWLLGAYKACGEWAANPNSWHVPAAETNTASLNLDLDRHVLPGGNVKYWVYFFDAPNGTIFLDLLSTNGMPVKTDLVGNLQRGSNVEAVVCLDIPLPKEAAVIQLRRGNGESRVFESLIYPDESGVDLQGQSKATYYYAPTGSGDAKDGQAQALAALAAKAKKASAGSQAGSSTGRRSLAGAKKDTVGAVNLRVFTHLE